MREGGGSQADNETSKLPGGTGGRRTVVTAFWDAPIVARAFRTNHLPGGSELVATALNGDVRSSQNRTIPTGFLNQNVSKAGTRQVGTTKIDVVKGCAIHVGSGEVRTAEVGRLGPV